MCARTGVAIGVWVSGGISGGLKHGGVGSHPQFIIPFHLLCSHWTASSSSSVSGEQAAVGNGEKVKLPPFLSLSNYVSSIVDFSYFPLPFLGYIRTTTVLAFSGGISGDKDQWNSARSLGEFFFSFPAPFPLIFGIFVRGSK